MNLDVVQLYTSIKHIDGLCAMAWHLRDMDLPGWLRVALLRVTPIILTNNFSFQGYTFRQVEGTAMGCHLSVVYASVFMMRVERMHLTILVASSRLFVRFIDDLFAIIPRRLAVLAAEEPSTNGCSVCFTHEISTTTAVMLDVKISANCDGSLSSTLNFKQSNKLLYIHRRCPFPLCL